MWNRLMTWWCTTFHKGAINVAHEKYECPVCLRLHPVLWPVEERFRVKDR
jgi:hypothetical protein